MPTISNVSFSVRFNLTSTPTLVLTDTTTSPPAGLVGIFEITQPDGYIRTGNIDSPDIAAAGGSFSFTLSPDSSGGVQCGTYTIKYTAAAPSYLSTDFTRSFSFTYTPVAHAITTQFDLFIPKLKFKDDTDYSLSGYTSSSLTRSWSVSSTPTGTITSSSDTIDLAYNGSYYDALYTGSFTSGITYTNNTYSWLSITESITSSISEGACTPLDTDALVALLEDLRLETNCSGDIPKFEKAQSLLSHMMQMISVNFANNAYVNDVFSVYENIAEILNVTCVHSNQPIPVYQLTFLVGSWYTNTVEGGTADSIYLPIQVIQGGYA